MTAPAARGLLYRGVTRLTPQRLDRLRRTAPGRVALGAAQRLAGRGPIIVAAGPAAGLRLSAEHLELTNFQAYGLVRGTVEPAVQQALAERIRPGHVVYDIGANIGFFALLAARLAGPDGRVEAFEPSPQSAAAVRAHAALNGLANVTVHEVAVGAAGGAGRLLHVDERGWSHLDDRGWHPRTTEVVDVDVVAIDDLVDGGLPAPDVIKLDVEGSEIDALGGMTRTLRSARPVLVCELHRTEAEVPALLRELGYRVEDLPDPAEEGADNPSHVLALP